MLRSAAVRHLLRQFAMLPGIATATDSGWQGEWRVTRDDPRLYTRAAAELLSLRVIEVSDTATRIQWQTGRAICEDPLAEPCEWIGASGEAVAVISGGSLMVVLPVSADDGDPVVLQLARVPASARASGVLFSARGGLRYAIEAERPSDR